MDLEKFKQAYNNFLLNEELYIKVILYKYLEPKKIEDVDKIFDFIMQNSINLLSDDILEINDEIKEGNFSSKSIKLIQSIYQSVFERINKYELNEILRHSTLIVENRTQEDIIFLQFKGVGEKYAILFNNDLAVEMWCYNKTYNLEIKESSLFGQKFYMLKVFDNGEYIGKLFTKMISMTDKRRYEIGILTTLEEKDIISEKEEERKKENILETSLEKFLKYFNDIKIDRSFDVLMEFKRANIRSNNDFCNIYFLTFYKFLFSRKNIEDLKNINHKSYSVEEIRQLFAEIDKMIQRLALFLQQFNTNRESLNNVIKRAKSQMEENSV
ncbi:hypothetical protein LV469_01380 [Peptoniphilus sp. GNH]|nr:hypothetical protein LV469_01380 [Peptoniphilus sp. GNH]